MPSTIRSAITTFSRWLDGVLSDAEAGGWAVTFSGRGVVIPRSVAPANSGRRLDRTRNNASAWVDDKSQSTGSLSARKPW